MPVIPRPAARLFDLVLCDKGACFPGFIGFCYNYTVFIDGRPAAALGDWCANCVVGIWACFPIGDFIVTGSLDCFINFRPAARLFDKCVRGIIVWGSFDTFIGG